jgi:hypothetical protein
MELVNYIKHICIYIKQYCTIVQYSTLQCSTELALAHYTTGVQLGFFPHVGNKEILDAWKGSLTLIHNQQLYITNFNFNSGFSTYVLAYDIVRYNMSK